MRSCAQPVAAARTCHDLALSLPVATCQVEVGQLPGSALALLQEQNWCTWLQSLPGFRRLLQRWSGIPCNLKTNDGWKFLSSAVSHPYSRRYRGFALCLGGGSAWSLSGCVSGHAFPSAFPPYSFPPSCALFSIHSLKGMALGVSWSPRSSSITCQLGEPEEMTNLTEPHFPTVKMGGARVPLQSLMGWVK